MSAGAATEKGGGGLPSICPSEVNKAVNPPTGEELESHRRD